MSVLLQWLSLEGGRGGGLHVSFFKNTMVPMVGFDLIIKNC